MKRLLFLKSFISFFIKVITKKVKNPELIDKAIFIPFYKKDRIIKDYELSIKKSNLIWSDNFYKQLRYYSLYQIAEYVSMQPNFKNSNIAECGVWKGHSAFMISKIFKKNNFFGEFHIFDSFEGGLSDKTKNDTNLIRKMSNYDNKFESKIFSSTLVEVKKTLKTFNFVKYFPGWIPDCFPKKITRNYSFVHIDVDLYKPTLDSLIFFWDKLEKNGYIVVDDYGSSQFPGATKAVDCFLKNKEISFFYKVPLGGCFIIK